MLYPTMEHGRGHRGGQVWFQVAKTTISYCLLLLIACEITSVIATRETSPATILDVDVQGDVRTGPQLDNSVLQPEHLDERKISRVVEWLEANGAKVAEKEKVRIVPGNEVLDTVDATTQNFDTIGGYNLRALSTSGLKQGEVLLEIPPNLWITHEDLTSILPQGSTQKPTVVPTITYKNGDEEEDPEIRLWAWLLNEREKGNASFWEPFISTLPTTHDHPIFWNPIVSDQLQMETYYKKAAAQRVRVEEFHRRSQKEKIFPKTVEVDDHKWAFASIVSRAISLKVKGEEVFVLLPFVDMLPKRNESEVSLHIEGGKAILEASKNVTPGAFLHLNVEEKGNDYLLLRHGFLFMNNTHDSVVIFKSLKALLQWYEEEHSTSLADGEGRKIEVENIDMVAARSAAKSAMAAVTLLLKGSPSTDRWLSLNPERAGFVARHVAEIDPRLIAALAAIHMTHLSTAVTDGQNEMTLAEEDYANIAELSFEFGIGKSITCQEMGAEYGSFLTFSIKALREHIRKSLRKLFSNVWKDEMTLNCGWMAFTAPEEDEETDPNIAERPNFIEMCPFATPLPRDLKMAIHLRHAKQKLMTAAGERLEEACS